jgi:hypothetical protein
MDDTCLVVRVSLMEIEGEMVYSLVDPPPGTRPLIPVMASIHAFIRASELQPLFAVTGRYWDISREVVPLSLDSVIGIVGRQTSLDLRVPKDLSAMIPAYGVMDNALGQRSDVTMIDLAVVHLLEATIDGIFVPVWLISSYGRKNTPFWGHREEYDSRLEVALAISDEGLRGNTVLKWDGFPEHPENIKVMDNLEERFREYQQQRR